MKNCGQLSTRWIKYAATVLAAGGLLYIQQKRHKSTCRELKNQISAAQQGKARIMERLHNKEFELVSLIQHGCPQFIALGPDRNPGPDFIDYFYIRGRRIYVMPKEFPVPDFSIHFADEHGNFHAVRYKSDGAGQPGGDIALTAGAWLEKAAFYHIPNQ